MDPNNRMAGDFGFADANLYTYVDRITIYNGSSQGRFRYRDSMSSYVGPSEDLNRGNGGRPGRWTLVVAEQSGTVPPAAVRMRLDPRPPMALGFENSINREVAGTIYDEGGLIARSFQVKVQDTFGNPVAISSPCVVYLSAISRRASAAYDSFSFSTAPSIGYAATPAFQSPTSTVTIPPLEFEATFYYLDTTASSEYPQGSTQPVIGVWDITGGPVMPGTPGAVSVLISSAQSVNIVPDLVSRVGVPPLANPVLLAGATSSAILFQVQDRFGNATPIKNGQEDPGKPYMAFNIYSNSTGNTQFSSPAPGSFIASTGTAYLYVGNAATSFYLIDTKMCPSTSAPWQLTVTPVLSRFWTIASATYTVQPGPPIVAGFTSDNRYLIAGTTVQMSTVTGRPADSFMEVDFFDEFGNLTQSSWAFHTMLVRSMNSPSSRGGTDPTKTVKDSGDWRPIGPGYSSLPVNIDIGQNGGRFYLWDTVIGTTSVEVSVVRQDGFSMPKVTQDEYVTPGPADYVTISHPFTPQNPLHVSAPGILQRIVNGQTLGVTMRDKFGNVASGHPINGQYFTGTVVFSHSGSSSTVLLQDITTNPPTPIAHEFKGAADPMPGILTGLQLTDFRIEELTIRATAYAGLSMGATTHATSNIWGMTNDVNRTFNDPAFIPTQAQRSDGNVFTAGIIVNPTDLAPQQNPDGSVTAAKAAAGQTHPVIRQGDGSTPGSPDPIAMLRLTMAVSPSDATYLSAVLASLQVQETGGLSPGHISELGFYADANRDGLFEAADDVLVATAVVDFNYIPPVWYFGDRGHGELPLNLANTTYPLLTVNPQNFFLTVRLNVTGYADSELPTDLGLAIPSQYYIQLTTENPVSQVGVASNNFAIKTATSPVQREPAQINVLGEDIAAWWTPLLDTSTTLPLSTYSFVNQGASSVGMLRLKMWSDAFNGIIDRIRVTHTGTGSDSDVQNVRLFVDISGADGDPTKGDQLFEATIDTEITPGSQRWAQGSLCTNDPAGTTSAQKTTFQQRSAVLNLCVLDPAWSNDQTYQTSVRRNLAQRTVGTSTVTYYVVLDFAPGAAANMTHGVKINGPSDVTPMAGNGSIVSFPPYVSTDVPVHATPDYAYIQDVDLQVGSMSAVATTLTQNDKSAPISKLTLRSNGSAVWSGIKLDRWIHSRALNGVIHLLNKASDVDDIKVWSDDNQDGMLQAVPDLVGNTTDQLVSPNNGVVHRFPAGQLSVAISSTDASPIDVHVANISDFFPSDDPFPPTPERLVLGDDQTDENRKEIMTCSGVDLSANVWRNCIRAMDGTVQLSFATGTVISGPARIPITGLGGGQMILNGARNYFVSFDIDPLATVNESANLGLMIPNTHYFIIQEPKQMAGTNVGLPPAGKTRSLVSLMAEYPDKMLVVASNTVDDMQIGPYFQQRSSGAVLSFTVNANVADALWRFVVVTATGSSASAGKNQTDVDLVSLWFDHNDDGFWEFDRDVLIATGTFGNSGSPLQTKLTLSAPRKILTLQGASSSQRFFVVYHMSAGAQTNDPSTQAPRTLGAVLRADAFPKANPQTDDPAGNAFSNPNIYDPASPLSFMSKMREIIPAAQAMYVRFTPMFTSSQGTFETPYLPMPDPTPTLANPKPALAQAVDQAFNPGTLDDFWQITSAQGLRNPNPAAGETCADGKPCLVMLVGAEYIAYESFSQSPPGLNNVHRGVPPTAPGAAHAHDIGAALTMISPMVPATPQNASTDPYWVVSSTLGLLGGGTTVYLCADREFIGYQRIEFDGTSGEWHLANVARGAQGSVPEAHAAGTNLIQCVPPAASGAVDPEWVVTSTAGLPAGGPTTYMLVDSELISYDQAGPGKLIGVHRGLLDTLAATHYAHAMLAPEVEQGSPNNALLKLEAYASDFQVQWDALRMQFEAPPGLNTSDGDLLVARLWKSIDPPSAPAFHRDNLTRLDQTDSMLAASPIVGGVATFNIVDPAFANSNYTLIPTSTRTFYVSVDISQATRFTNPGLPVQQRNEALGRYRPQSGDFTLGPPGAGHRAGLLNQPYSPGFPIVPTVNTMSMAISHIAPGSASQNAENVPIARLIVHTDSNTVNWQKLRVDHVPAGTLDTDVTVVRLWEDADNDGQFTAVDMSTNILGSYQHLMSNGSEAFSSGTVVLQFPNSILVSTTAKSYFVTYSFSQFAGVGSLEGLSLGGTGYVTVQVPHRVTVTPATFETNPKIVMQEVPSWVMMGVYDWIYNQNVSVVAQAQADTPFLRFNLATDVGLGTWQNLRVSRNGGSQDLTKLFGRNTDVSFIRIYRDMNQNDVLDSNDLDISQANTTLVSGSTASPVAVGIPAGTQPFAMVVASTAGFPASGIGRVYVGDSELMTFSGGYGTALVNGTAYPTLTILSRGDVLGSTTPAIAHPVGCNVRKVDVFDQSNDQDLQTLIELALPQTISPTAGVFFLTYDVGATAVKNDELSVDILDKSWIGVASPKNVSGQLYVNVSKLQPAGTQTSLFPFHGTKVHISPVTMKIEARNIAPAAAMAGQTNVPIEQITLSVNSDFVRIARLKLTQLGSVSEVGRSSAAAVDARAVSVWLDNGSQAFAPNAEQMIGRLTHADFPGGSALFSNGVANVDLSVSSVPYLTVTTVPVTVFIACDISTVSPRLGRTTLGDHVGFSVERFEDMYGPNLADLTANSDGSNVTQFPARSTLVLISTAIIPLTSILPPVTMGVPEQWRSSPELSKFSYPCYAQRDSAGNVLVSTKTAYPLCDESKWITAGGRPWRTSGASAAAGPDSQQVINEPLIDINGDGLPDNFDFLQTGRRQFVSLLGTDKPSTDLDGYGLLEVDINGDGIPDQVLDDGKGNPLYFLVDKDGKKTQISNTGLALSAWNSNSTSLSLSWQVPSSTQGIAGFQLAVGDSFENYSSFTFGWKNVSATSSGTVVGLALPVPKVTRLTEPLGPSDTTIKVADASNWFKQGKLVIGAETVGAQWVSATEFQVVSGLPGCPGATGRGCLGSVPQTHLAGEVVSDGIALVSVRAFTGSVNAVADYIPSASGRPLVMYRIDTTPPSAPASVTPRVPPGQASGSSFAVFWEAA